ncbi:hypothetical protein B0H12DRAFT_1071050 [Mycena haematopus]|nr:hypothetical protein B0H12DRAFT_1071050 [Mycena haematopus]
MVSSLQAQMTPRCSECGAFVISKRDDFEVTITTTPRTLARYQNLVNTNEPPQDLDLALIRPVVEKTEAHLASLEAEMSRLKEQLSHLAAEHAALSKYHSQNTTILFPLRRVPAEILAEIFQWTLPRISAAPLNIRNSPWVLTHVSSHWRAVAVAKSSLWSQLFLDFSLGQHYSLQMVRTHVERARTLKIRFYGSQHRNSRLQIDLLVLLSQHSSIWEELRIQLTSALVPHIEALRGPLPALRRVWLQWDGAKSQEGVESISCFRTAVSLVHVSAYSAYRFIPTLLPIHLTRYSLDAPWSTHAELLKSLPYLQEVRISCDFEMDPDPPGSRIELLHLRRLYVSEAWILGYLKAPRLIEIAIEEDDLSSLEPFLIQSSCTLRRLCIQCLDVWYIAEILQKYPSITELAILMALSARTESQVLAACIAHFAVSNFTPASPHLVEISFGCRTVDAISYPLYLDMVASRWNADGCALKAVELVLPKLCPAPDPASLARIDTLRQAGLEISLFSGEDAVTRLDRWMHIASWD